MCGVIRRGCWDIGSSSLKHCWVGGNPTWTDKNLGEDLGWGLGGGSRVLERIGWVGIDRCHPSAPVLKNRSDFGFKAAPGPTEHRWLIHVVFVVAVAVGYGAVPSVFLPVIGSSEDFAATYEQSPRRPHSEPAGGGRGAPLGCQR